MKKALVLLLVCTLAAGFAFGSGGKEQQQGKPWPSEAVTMICPWGAGGIADLAIRAIAQHGQKYFGQPIVPVNRTGAGGVVAVTDFLKQKPNDPAIIMASEGIFATLPLMNDVTYKWENFTPVIGCNTSSFIFIINAKKGIKTFEELIAYGKKNKILYASTGLGSDNQVIAATLFKLAGVDSETIGYSGSAPALNALLAGDVLVAITHPALAKEHVKAGTVLPLVVFDKKDWTDDVYNVPSVTKFGYDVVLPNLNFFMMPAGTDPKIIQSVHDKIKAIYQEEGFKELVKKLDLRINPASPEEIKQHIDSSIVSAKRFYEIVGIKKK